MIKVKNKFYITAAIPYVNAKPHIGHALEFIQTDCIARYHKLAGEKVFLTTGSDENSLKNVQAAEELGLTVDELCRKNAEEFKKMAKLAGMSIDSFLRSSSPKDHWPGVQMLWRLCEKSGDIYKKKYKGLYCVGCEAFYTESELIDGKCTEHKKIPELVEEENYFFRLSKYQKTLEKLIEKDEIKIIPETRKHEVLSFIRSGLEDFSISRSKKRAKGWGVPVPGDDSQIIYVWFDALNVYQTAIGFGTDEKLYKKWWPCDCHVIGKGIIRFHAVYWPAMLLSAKLELPKSIFVHGYVTIDGQKMSKSLGNVVDPVELVNKYGQDRLRYYILKEISPFDDGDFSETRLIECTNAELVSNFSNLFYRVTSFIEKNFDGKVPEGELGAKEKTLVKKIDEVFKKYIDCLENYRINIALTHAMEISSLINKYFQKKEPWETIKKDKKDCALTLYTSVNALRIICSMLQPFIPEAAEKALYCLGCKPTLDTEFNIKPAKKVKSEKIFVVMEAESKEIKTSETIEKIEVINGMIPLKEFQKLELKIGTIIDVKDHPNAEKLYVLQIDIGEKRQLVAGLRGIYTKEQLLGRQVVVIANLEPKELRGIKSHGMLLAADNGTLLAPEKKIANGMKVR